MVDRAGFLYLFIMAAICVFFKGASTYDRTMEEHERQLLSSLVDRMYSEYQEDSSLQMPDALPSGLLIPNERPVFISLPPISLQVFPLRQK